MTKPKNKKQQPKTNEPEKNVEQDEVITAKEPEDNKPEPKSETPEKQEESYSIYEYLKKNPSVLISTVSAMVVVISGVLKIGLYVYHTEYLKYWNIDYQLYSSPEISWLKNITFSFLYIIFNALFLGITYSNIKLFITRKRVIKIIKTLIKDCKSEIKILKNIHKKNGKNNREGLIFKYQSDIDDLNIKKKETKKIIRIEFIVNSILVIFLMIVNCGILAFETGKFVLNLAKSFILTMIMVFIIWFIAKIKDKQNEEPQIEDINKYYKERYIFTRLFLSDSKNFLSNINIKIFIMNFLLISIIFPFLNLFSGYVDAEKIRDFSIITINNKEYAVMYSNEDNFLAEEIIINGKKAIIKVNDQILIPKENIEMKVYSFESVSRKKDDEDMTEEDTA